MEAAKEGMGVPWVGDTDGEGPSHGSSTIDRVQVTSSGSGEGIDRKKMGS